MPFCSKSIKFNPEKDIPSLSGKIVFVTGGSTGLGRQAVLEFARHNPAEIWLTSRNFEKAKVAAEEIHQLVPGSLIKPLELDLTSFQSIVCATTKFHSESQRLDILMLNAGVMATPPGLSEDGYEIQFAANTMGHSFLTKILLPTLEKTARILGNNVRIVSVSSYGHTYVGEGKFNFAALKDTAEELGTYGRYSQSKLASVLWTRQLAREYPQFTVAAVHPGVVQTELMNGATASPSYVRVFVKLIYGLLATVENGVRNQLWASVSEDVVSGEYYEPVGVSGMASANGRNDSLAKEMWDWIARELELQENCIC
ncbi:short-chain dehydrogenase/reductase [Camillea tinctor]|nr:short-chain dehydrogenase/reductase [Camillea tinctor]